MLSPNSRLFDTVGLYNPIKVLSRVRSGNSQILMANECPGACVVSLQEIDQDESIDRIRLMRPFNGALFPLRLILLERPMNSSRNGIHWAGTQKNS